MLINTRENTLRIVSIPFRLDKWITRKQLHKENDKLREMIQELRFFNATLSSKVRELEDKN